MWDNNAEYYREFKYQLYSEEAQNNDANTDDNDPEYVYNDDILCPGWRYDLNELSELQQDDKSETSLSRTDQTPWVSQHQRSDTNDDPFYHDHYHEPSTSNNQQQQGLPNWTHPTKPTKRLFHLDDEAARILNQQLRQQIQLLTQTFLLTVNTTNMKNEAEEAKNHLLSYQRMFRNKQKPSNLNAALDLVTGHGKPEVLKTPVRINWRPLPVPEPVKRIIRNNPQVFIYNRLKPKVSFSIAPKQLLSKVSKINFTFNEDCLLAYALNEFQNEGSPYAYIASLLMTAKTKTQISNHIKNIKRSPGCEDNPLKLFYTAGRLPDIDLSDDKDLSRIEENQDSFTSEPELDDSKQEQKLSLKSKGEFSNMFAKEPVQETPQQINQQLSNQEILHEPPVVDMLPQIQEQEVNSVPDLEQDYFMDMDLDDLMAASTTISKTAYNNSNNNSINNGGNNQNCANSLENKNIRYVKLKQSMINLMTHEFVIPESMGSVIIYEFLKASQTKLTERNNFHLLQLLSDLLRMDLKKDCDSNNNNSNNSNSNSNNDDNNSMETNTDSKIIVKVYEEISKFLSRIDAPQELQDRIVLFLDLEQANKCGCSIDYLHWMRCFEFMQHLEIFHDNMDVLEKKLLRLVDALQKDDIHKRKLAVSNLISKNAVLKRDFDFLSLNSKPHPSLFNCEEDFDDITDPFNVFEKHKLSLDKNLNHQLNNVEIDHVDLRALTTINQMEHFNCKVTKEELAFASPNCNCRCHSGCANPTSGQHCADCNLKFMRGRMYLVNKIKPVLAKWSYVDPPPQPPPAQIVVAENMNSANNNYNSKHNYSNEQVEQQQQPHSQPPVLKNDQASRWTFEEDKELLEFCRAKAEQNEETVSFDVNTFEELIAKRKAEYQSGGATGNKDSMAFKKTAKEISERFNQLMELYKGPSDDANSSSSQQQQHQHHHESSVR